MQSKDPYGRNYFSEIQAVSSAIRAFGAILATRFIVKDKVAAEIGSSVCGAFGNTCYNFSYMGAWVFLCDIEKNKIIKINGQILNTLKSARFL